MRFLRKGLSFGVATLLLLLSGCVNSNGNTPPKEGPIEITFWHGMSYDSAHGKTLQELVKEFNASQQEVRVKETYQGSYDDLSKKLTGAIAAKTPPTVIQNTDSQLTGLVKRSALLPLDSLVPAEEKADYPPSLLTAQTMDGKLYALPFNKSIIVLVYNKNLVPNPPKTWEEFRSISKALSGSAKYGTVFEAGAYTFGLHFVQAGGEWIKDGKAAFNDDAGVTALQFLVDLVKEGLAVQLKPREYQSNYFNEGRVAMIATTSASFAHIKPAGDQPWGVAPLFSGPKNDLTSLSGANLSIVAGITPEQSQAAAKFLLWMTGKEATLKWATAKTGYMPVRKSAVQSATWQTFVQENPIYAVLGTGIDKGTVHPNHPEWGNVLKVITTAVEEAVLGKATPKDALDKAAKAADDLLRKQ